MQRKTFLAASAITAAAVSACAKGSANEIEIVEAATEFNYGAFKKLVDKPSDARQLWDCERYNPQALVAIKNAYNGYQFGFGMAPGRIAIAACLHGNANALAYDDSMWQKYAIGTTLGIKDDAGNVVPGNVLARSPCEAQATHDPNDPQGAFQHDSLDALGRRGLTVLVCHTAAAAHAMKFARAAAVPDPAAVLSDLLGHLRPGVVVVPAQVAAIGVLQTRFHYAYTIVGGQ